MIWDWGKAVLIFLQLANWAAGYIDRAQARRDGTNAQIVAETAALQQRLGIAKEVEAETAKMSDADLDKELAGDDS
jgi:hypothetical protein